MTYRDDLSALAARHDALAHEVAQKTRELDQSRRLLDQANARARLPVLDNIRIASPCTADWNQMTGDERTRHCGECRKNVYNLSDMTRDEAEALLIERNGDLCVRYFQRHDGTILLADCTIGAKRRSRRRWIAAGAAAMLAGGAGAGALLRTGPHCEQGSDPHSGQILMGDIAAMPDLPPQPAQDPAPPELPAPGREGSWTAGAVSPTPLEPAESPHRPAHPAHPAPKMGKLVRSR
jgi:hypothetical protein